MDISPRNPVAGAVRVALRRARILWWRGGVPVPVRGQAPGALGAGGRGEARRSGRAWLRTPKNKTPRAVRLRGFEQ